MTLWGAWGTANQPAKAAEPVGPGTELQVELEPLAEPTPSLSEGIRGLYQRCQFYDIVVVAAEKRFPAHQVALAATSPALEDAVKVLRLAAALPLEAPAGAPREAPPGGHPELRLEQISDPEAARALLDYVYGMDGSYNVSSDTANRDVLRLAQQFGLPRLEERAVRWLVEGLTSHNVVSRLVDLQEFGLTEPYELMTQQLVSSASALAEVASKPEVMDHPKILQHLLVRAAQWYRAGVRVAVDVTSPKRSSSAGESEWSCKRAKASRKLAHVGA